MKNKYIKISHISEPKFREIVKLFSEDLNATQIAYLTKLNRNTINRYLMLFRERIVKVCDKNSPLHGEVDESYLENSIDKTIVFGLLKVEDKIYTEIVPNVIKTTLQSMLKEKIDIDSIIYSDEWHGYHAFVDVNSDKYFRVPHGKNEFERGNSHMHGMESFWNYTKNRLLKFQGVDKKTFNLHLKESEFRFNNRGIYLYKLLLKIFREEPII